MERKPSPRRASRRRDPRGHLGTTTIIHTDGACKGNPGPSSAAAVIIENGKVTVVRARKLGVRTNNEAEYEGLLCALEICLERGLQDVIVRMDSKLVAKQFPHNGWKCNFPNLEKLRDEARALSRGIKKFKIEHVRREYNVLADEAANDVLVGRVPHTPKHDTATQIQLIEKNTVAARAKPTVPQKVAQPPPTENIRMHAPEKHEPTSEDRVPMTYREYAREIQDAFLAGRDVRGNESEIDTEDAKKYTASTLYDLAKRNGHL